MNSRIQKHIKWQIISIISFLLIIFAPSAFSLETGGREFYLGNNYEGKKSQHRVFLKKLSDLPMLMPGDKVFLGEGILKENLTIKSPGSQKKPIIITSWPGEKPVIEGSVYLAKNVHDIELSNIEIRNTKEESGIRMSLETERISIIGCNIHDVAFNGIYCAGNYHLVKDNIINNVGLQFYPYKTHGIYVKANNTKIVGNKCSNSQRGNGIRSEGKDLLIRDNVTFNNSSHGISVFADIETRNVEITSNTSHENAEAGISILGGSIKEVPNNINIIENIIFNNRINVMLSGKNAKVLIHKNILKQPSQIHLSIDKDSSDGLSISSNSYEGKGRFIINGQVFGDVMTFANSGLEK